MPSYEITFTYQEPILQVTTLRWVTTAALPGLPLTVPRPDNALEVVHTTATANEQVLYRRPYARLGYAEAYGPDSEWTRLPAGHPQVLVSLIPADFDSPLPLDVVIYAGGSEKLRIPLPPPQQLASLLAAPTAPPDPGAAATVEGLVLIHGDVDTYERRFNLVFVAEGYRLIDRLKFERDVDSVLASLQNTAPFGPHIGSINVFRLDVWSMETGADRGTADPVNTHFDAVFPGTFAGSAAPPQLLVVDEKIVLARVSYHFQGRASLPHKIIVLVNSEHYGGSGGAGDGIAVASRYRGDGTMERVVLHELGHTFGLVDEYPAGGGWGPNLSNYFDIMALPWKDLVVSSPTPVLLPTIRSPGVGAGISFATIGAFQDPDLPNWYRPQWLCRMRFTRHDSFCTVCASHIERALKPGP